MIHVAAALHSASLLKATECGAAVPGNANDKTISIHMAKPRCVVWSEQPYGALPITLRNTRCCLRARFHLDGLQARLMLIVPVRLFERRFGLNLWR